MILPLNALVPVAEDIVSIPLAPAPIVVVPLTVKANAPAVKVVPSPTLKLPVILKFATKLVVTVPLNVKFPEIDTVPVCKVVVPEPERVKLL